MKVGELEGMALDQFVVKALGMIGLFGMCNWKYSSEWRESGPIIEREHIAISGIAFGGKALLCDGDGPECWTAHMIGEMPGNSRPLNYSGPTPLIAAMRCFVASKLGDTVPDPETIPEFY